MNTQPLFTPVNALEQSLQQAQEGKLSSEAFMEELFMSKLFMPSTVPLDQGFDEVVPLAWQREGTPMAGVFTSLERMEPHQETIRGYVSLPGAELFLRSVPGWGLVINPGWTVGMEIPAHAMAEIRNGLKARKATLGTGSESGGMSAADAAIRAARAGGMSVPDMLRSVLAAKVLVPLAEPPVMEGASMVSWNPATVTRASDGERFVPVFTDEDLDRAYAKSRPEYPYRLELETAWLLQVLPPDHGLAFNLGGEANAFEWPARGISAYTSRQGP